MNTTPEIATIIEVAQVKTSQGPSILTKCWSENQGVISLWSDPSATSPFLKGKEVGDTIRVVGETRKSLDMNGRETQSTRWTIIPDSPAS